MNIYEKLGYIQEKLKANKTQYNKFGGYAYRNCEDILEAVKPLLKETKTVILLTDNIELVGDRYYIKVCAKLVDCEAEHLSIENYACAREEETKKGMDGSQITGSASSYARKYALNGLFGIDDNKDSDTTNTHNKEKYTCSVCNKVIEEKIYNASIEKYNVSLCSKECLDKYNNKGEN